MFLTTDAVIVDSPKAEWCCKTGNPGAGMGGMWGMGGMDMY